MRVNRWARPIALSIVPLMAYAGGCSSGSSPNAPADSGSGSSGGGSSGAGTDSGGSASSGGSSSGGTMEACAAPCQTACATELCAAAPANPMSGDSCDVCFRRANSAGGPCYAAVSAACGADQDCIALYGPQGCNARCQSLGDGGGPSDAAGSDASEDSSVADSGDDAGGDEGCLGAGSATLCEQCCARVHKEGATTALTAELTCSCCS